jgi:leucyl-tRNA synthetase
VTLSPIFPHLCEELWHELGADGSIFTAHWPEITAEIESTKTVKILINQKFVATLSISADTDNEEAKELALGDSVVQEKLADRKIAKVFYKPGELLNLILE